MAYRNMMATAAAALVIGALGSGMLAAPERPSLAGRWTLNRGLSQFPRDVGFGMNLVSAAGSVSDSGAMGNAGSVASAALLSVRESEEDARRMKLLVDAVRTPSPHLSIAQTDAAVTITDDFGRSLTFHPDGREETQTLDQVPVTTVTRWDGAHLVVRYKVTQDRELRYTFSRTLEPPQLAVEAQFVERGGRQAVTRVYEPAKADEPARTAEPVAPEAPKAVSEAPPGTVRATDLGRPPAPTVPAVPAPPDRAQAPLVSQGPDAELRGLTAIGLVVEDLSAQAAACGLNRASIEAAVSKSFTDAGFTVRRNSDEDTYIYVRIITTSAPGGMCVSGFDAYLYTHTNAILPYQTTPVLVQVLLLHNGGIAGGGPAAHAEAVLRNVKQYVDEFASRIRAANAARKPPRS